MKQLFKYCVIILCLTSWMPICAAQDKFELKIGYIPLAIQLPLIVSYENDRFNLESVELQLYKYNKYTSVEAAFRVGAIDAAVIPFPIILSIASDSLEKQLCQISILGAVHQGGSFLASKMSDNQEDLKGSLIGLSGLDSMENYLLIDYFGKINMRYGMEYKTIGIPFNTAVYYLSINKLNAIFLPEPYGTLAVQKGIAKPVIGQTNILTGTFNTALIIRSSLLDTHPEAITEWLKSVVHACQFIEHDIKTSKAMQTAIIQTTYFDFPKEIIVESLVERRGGLKFDEYLFDPIVLEKLFQKASELKFIMKSVDIKTLCRFDLIKSIINK